MSALGQMRKRPQSAFISDIYIAGIVPKNQTSPMVRNDVHTEGLVLNHVADDARRSRERTTERFQTIALVTFNMALPSFDDILAQIPQLEVTINS